MLQIKKIRCQLLQAQKSLLYLPQLSKHGDFFLPYLFFHLLIQQMLQQVSTLSQALGQMLESLHLSNTNSSCWHSLMEVRNMGQRRWDNLWNCQLRGDQGNIVQWQVCSRQWKDNQRDLAPHSSQSSDINPSTVFSIEILLTFFSASSIRLAQHK